MHRFFVATTLLHSVAVWAAAPEVTLGPDDDQLIAAICTVAAIPGPHGVGGQFELGALMEGEDRVEKKGNTLITHGAPRHGWVTIVTDEASLHVSAEQYTKDLKSALRGGRGHDRFPAPCVVHGAMQLVVLTAIILTDRGYVGVVEYNGTVQTLPAPEPDKKKAQIATMKLANGLASARLTPVWVRDLSSGRAKSGAKSGWAQAAESAELK